MLIRDQIPQIHRPVSRGRGYGRSGNGYGDSNGNSDGSGHGEPVGVRGLREFFYSHVDGAYPSTCADFPTAVYLTRVHPLLELPCC